MKAAVLYGKDDIRYEDYKDISVKENEVKIKVKVCGICKSDVPRVLDGTAHFYPIILGHEFSGIVEKIGKNVKNVNIGDHVAGIPLIPCLECDDCKKGNYSLCKNYSFIGSRTLGAYSEYVVVPQNNVYKISNDISFEKGALFEPATVALHALNVANFKSGKKVAVIGLGTIGTFILQWCRIYGSNSITVFSGSKEKEDLAKRLGATDFVHNSNISGSKYENQYDYVFDAAGIESTIKNSFLLAANKATICFVGTPTKDLSISWKMWELINRKEMKITGSWMSYSKPFPGSEWEKTAECFQNNSLLFDQNIIYKEVPLSNAKQIFEEYKTPGKVKGRVLLKGDK